MAYESHYRKVKHPVSGKFVYEHRLVMELHIGRPLLSTEVVHHINHDRHDNRIENLELIASRSEHMKEHHRDPNFTQRGPRPHLQKPPVPCAWCGKEFRPPQKRVKCCSVSCAQQRRYHREPTPCVVCGAPIDRHATAYCSKSCAMKDRNATRPDLLPDRDPVTGRFGAR